jgi:RNA polymerase sigma-70 factor, ECF subfamily
MYEEFVHIVLLVRWSHAALRAQRIGLATHVDIRGWTEMDAAIATAAWLAAFHAGERSVMERCYRDQCVMVLRAAGAVLPRADAETVTHEVFYRLLSSARTRGGFQGGNFEAWLRQVATNAALDHVRRYRRERAREEGPAESEDAPQERVDDEVEAKLLVERFRRDRLPLKWAGVFDARFLRQLPQREAARELGIQRTTLVYQEQRIRLLLREFLLGERES